MAGDGGGEDDGLVSCSSFLARLVRLLPCKMSPTRSSTSVSQSPRSSAARRVVMFNRVGIADVDLDLLLRFGPFLSSTSPIGLPSMP